MVRTSIGLSIALFGVVFGTSCASSLVPSANDSDGGTGSNNPSGQCVGPLGPPITNLGSLEACCEAEGGQGHCKGDVPAELQNYLASCGGGEVCVPDQFLTTGGAVPPAECVFALNNSPGVCLSRCIPQVAENAALLEQANCTGDQLCVPCTNPLDNMPTGACDLAQYTQCVGGGMQPPGGTPTPACDDPATCEYEPMCPPVIDPSSLPSCGSDAHCLDRTLVVAAAGDVASQLKPCTDGSKLCVPDVFLETGGAYTPTTCVSVIEAEGRCMSTALPAIEQQQAMLPQANCAAGERCAPCYNPIDATATGACELGCDEGPTQPAKTFFPCCGGRARCIPQALVTEQQAENLGQDDCEDIAEDAFYCVPTQILLNETITRCNASSWLIGDYCNNDAGCVCLSDCLEFGLAGIALSGGTCADGFKCAPCINPQNGEATLAPGCTYTP